MEIIGNAQTLNTTVTARTPARWRLLRRYRIPSAVLRQTLSVPVAVPDEGKRTLWKAIQQSAWSTAASTNVPSSPTVASRAPPSSGPSTRVPLLARVSTPMARPRNGPRTTSPMSVRRTGKSVIQNVPPRNAATPRCHTSIRPDHASTARPADSTHIAVSPHCIRRRRSSRSAAAPANAPKSASGRSRSKVIAAVVVADLVSAYTYTPNTSISSQRTRLVRVPTRKIATKRRSVSQGLRLRRKAASSRPHIGADQSSSDARMVRVRERNSRRSSTAVTHTVETMNRIGCRNHAVAAKVK